MHSAVTSNEEQLGHIEYVGIRDRGRAARREREARRAPLIANDEREPSTRIRPVERKVIVPKASIVAELDLRKDVAEIVDVQLQQVLQQRRIRRNCRIE